MLARPPNRGAAANEEARRAGPGGAGLQTEGLPALAGAGTEMSTTRERGEQRIEEFAQAQQRMEAAAVAYEQMLANPNTTRRERLEADEALMQAAMEYGAAKQRFTGFPR